MEEALIKRVLPHSLEAEQSVIGSMLMDREAVIAASEIVTGSDFYQQQYGIMFDAMVELFNEGKPVDLVTLQDRLKEKDVPPEVSSLDFVRDIVTMVPTSANVRSYATIVGEKAVLRRLIKTTEEIANTCYAGKEPLENILADTEKSVFNLLQNRGGQDFVPIKQVAINVLEKIEDAYKNQGTVTGIPSGFIDLDYKLSGFQPSDFILIAARPSMGKTAFVLNVVDYVAVRKSLPCMVFSLEMSKEQLVNRMLSMESNVDSQKLRTGSLTDSDWDAEVVRNMGAAMMTETELEIEFLGGCYNTQNNHVLAGVVAEAMNEIPQEPWTQEELDFAAALDEQTADAARATTKKYGLSADTHLYTGPGQVTCFNSYGSTDVGDVMHLVPTAYFFTACTNMGAPAHSWQFASCAGSSIGEKGMIYAAKVMALYGLKLIEKPELIAQAKEEFDRQMEGRSYKCPIPDGMTMPW